MEFSITLRPPPCFLENSIYFLHFFRPYITSILPFMESYGKWFDPPPCWNRFPTLTVFLKASLNLYQKAINFKLILCSPHFQFKLYIIFCGFNCISLELPKYDFFIYMIAFRSICHSINVVF